MALRQPTSLLDTASHVLGTVIGEQALLVTEKICSDSESNTSKESIGLELNIKKLAQFYDETIPQNLHNVVTYNTLKYVTSNNFEVTKNSLNVCDLVLRSHVTKFNFLDWPVKMRSMLHMILPNLKNLKFLYLDIDFRNYTNLNYILQGIEGMKRLNTFRCNNCRDDIIKVLCDNCPLINLDICDSRQFVTDMSVPSILKLQNLRRLNISETKISKEGQKQLLLELPHLKTLRMFDLKSVLRKMDDGNVTSLQNVEYFCTKECDLINLIKFCPSITELEIYNYRYKDLSNLANLKCLTSLYVSCDFYKSNITTILETNGNQLTELELCCKNISTGTLHVIDTSCPNLMKLTLNCHSIHDEAECLSDGKAFQNLQYFASNDMFKWYNLTALVITFLCTCIKIKEVEFFVRSNICDADIDKILTHNPLVNLEKLYLKNHNLSLQSLYKLLTSCKKLRWLGSISGWRGVTEADIEDILIYIEINNLDVQLIDNYQENLQSVML